jgi:peptide deformylase
MMNQLVDCNHPLLNTCLDPFDFNNTEIDPKEIAEILYKKMVEHNALGLAANQIGLPYRVFIMRGDPCLVCFNPRIVDASDSQVVLEEGCLTYPDLYVKIRRPAMIKVRYTNELGETKTEKFSGITARCFQHELDHLNGVNYLSRANKYHLSKAKQKVKYIKRKRNNVGVI